MKKKVFGRKLSREKDSRRALFRNLARALVLCGKIETTRAKAKSVQPFVEKLVTLAKEGSLSARRRVYSILGNDRRALDALFVDVVPNFSRESGFTKIIPLPSRRGDRSEMVRLEWSEQVAVSKERKVTSGKEKAEGKKSREKGIITRVKSGIKREETVAKESK